MTTLLTLLVVFGLALTLSLVLTPQVIRYAKACGWVSTPREDRYSDTATPLMGGIAIVAAAGLATLIGFRHLSTLHLHILAAGLLMFAVGVYDDRRTLTAKTKLLWQAGAALWLVAAGVRFGIGGDAWLWVDRLITFCWLIGITNAVNLLDNMDGLAAGVSAITATSLAIIHAIDGNLGTAVMAVALVGAALGFLRYNFQPAQLFMGDCGSLFLGLTLASLALLDGGENPARGLLPVLALPILVLVLPLTDTLLVSIMRPRHGKKITEGGCDHTSHRLTKLGASTRDAVLMLYALAGLSAVLALVVRWLDWYWGHLLLP